MSEETKEKIEIKNSFLIDSFVHRVFGSPYIHNFRRKGYERSYKNFSLITEFNPENEYLQHQKATKDNPKRVLVLEKNIGTGLKKDLEYFATSEEATRSQIDIRASKYPIGLN